VEAAATVTRAGKEDAPAPIRSEPGPGKVAPPKKKSKRDHGSKRSGSAQAVAEELQKLRPVLRDIGGVVLDRLEGQLAGLALFLDGESLPMERTPLPPSRTLAAMLADVKGLKLKPKKGRVKDLARIEALLETLTAKMPPGT